MNNSHHFPQTDHNFSICFPVMAKICISDESVKVLIAWSCLTFVTLWPVACQAPVSIEFSRQEYWSGLPFPPPGDLPNLGIEPGSLALAENSLLSGSSAKPPTVFADVT